MEHQKISVRVLRQLNAELDMLDQLKQLCDAFSSIIETSTQQPPAPLDLKPAQELLTQFVTYSRSVLDSRTRTLQVINLQQTDNPLTIRQFISQAAEPIRTQLERKRQEIVQRLYEIRTQVAGDSAVVFYSFDFYRRIVNGLVNCIAEEQRYDQDGKTPPSAFHSFYQRAC